MSFSRAPRSRSISGRATLLTVVTLTGALTLTACGDDGGKTSGSAGGNYVTGSSGISTVAKADRTDAPKLDGETVDGKTLDTTTLKGKVVVLNVWGSWCPPCRAEAPSFAKVAKELEAAGQPVAFVGINTRDNTKQNALSFEETYGITYPSLFDPDGKLMLRFPKGTLNPNAIPSTLVLDKDGKIASRTLAALSEAKLRSMIDPLLAEK
ncbi:TlpA family protein disulfide reductase [Streptomyces sp. NBC_00335]|uniref:TlpA family protein disulfide reductase n=1 Tax=unclassified Streptomyces TaxID=2593676 RepID=UPI00225138F5|nr:MULTISPECIES: TlpA disulfide reductase family protein [unclassified Streptomyces]MCX5405394.1 TlpA family protein disulfide reductase [Streptomyces sp. NBC_00086]